MTKLIWFLSILLIFASCTKEERTVRKIPIRGENARPATASSKDPLSIKVDGVVTEIDIRIPTIVYRTGTYRIEAGDVETARQIQEIIMKKSGNFNDIPDEDVMWGAVTDEIVRTMSDSTVKVTLLDRPDVVKEKPHTMSEIKREYTVVKGDYMSKIAFNVGVSLKTLERKNPGVGNHNLVPGMRLKY